jgi:hypothetical protein
MVVLLGFEFSDRDHRGLTGRGTKPRKSGRTRSVERTGQAENWGRPFGGTDFLLARPGIGFNVPVNQAALRDRQIRP